MYKVTVLYDFVHYGYFMEGLNDIIRVLGYNLLIRPIVQLYLYSGIKYNQWLLWTCQELTKKPKAHWR